MVYESDFYTTRRTYPRPTITSYTVTRLVDRDDLDSRYSWPVRREFSRILCRPRPHLGVVYTERFLNSVPLTYFDDETKSIRAEAGALLKKVYTPVPRPHRSYRPFEVLDTLTSCHLGPSSISNRPINLSYYKDPDTVSIGRGHLACMRFAGGRGYPRRKQLYGDEMRNIRDEIKFRSYYKKASQPEPASLPTGPEDQGFASRLYHLPLKPTIQSPYKIFKSKSFTYPTYDNPPAEVKNISMPVKTVEVKKEVKPEPIKEVEPEVTEVHLPKKELPKEPITEDSGVQEEVTFSFKRKSPKKVSEPTEVLSQPKPENPAESTPLMSYSIKLPRKSGSVESSTEDNSKKSDVEEEGIVTMKAPSPAKSDSKSSSRRSSENKKLDDNVQKRSTSKSRSKTPDVVVSEPEADQKNGIYPCESIKSEEPSVHLESDIKSDSEDASLSKGRISPAGSSIGMEEDAGVLTPKEDGASLNAELTIGSNPDEAENKKDGLIISEAEEDAKSDKTLSDSGEILNQSIEESSIVSQEKNEESKPDTANTQT